MDPMRSKLKNMGFSEAKIDRALKSCSEAPPSRFDPEPSDGNLRDREMAADPMLEYFREKNREKQGIPAGKPIYRGHYPPNRYNIRPGHRWDGVDRSNGFEKKLLEREAKLKASEEESYRNATRDCSQFLKPALAMLDREERHRKNQELQSYLTQILKAKQQSDSDSDN